MRYLHHFCASMHNEGMATRIDTAQLEEMVTFLAVARLGTYTSAAKSLNVNHSTVSRRISDLEKALGDKLMLRSAGGWELTELGERALPLAEQAESSLRELAALNSDGDSPRLRGHVHVAAPDAFTSHIAIPALAGLQKAEPGLGIDVITATQQVRQRRSGVDFEIVIGEPTVNKAVTKELLQYRLCLYASAEYLEREGTPESIADLVNHRINYYIESALQVDDLDLGIRQIPEYRRGISSTSVFAHMAATRSGAGIGLLPEFAVRDSGLVPVLHDVFSHQASYWAVVRQENLRNPAVRACLQAIVDGADEERRRSESVGAQDVRI